MTPEEKNLLQRTLELTEENHKMLKSMSRSMKLARIMSIIYWVFIIGSAVGAYYLIQPYIDAITGAYGGAKTTFDGGIGSYLDLFK
jgi:Trk-type K+ transport system membrane component